MENSGRNFIGMSKAEMAMENWDSMGSDGKPTVKKFYNWQPCKYWERCPAMKSRLKTLLIKEQKYCMGNPSIEECKMYRFLGEVVREYGFSYNECTNESGFCGDIEALCLDIEENGWKK